MSLDNKFSLPSDISMGRALVAAISLGWSPAIHITVQNGKDNLPTIRVHFSLTHKMWHGTLCEVHGAGLIKEIKATPDAGIILETAIRDTVVDAMPKLQKLWSDYQDAVPYLLNGEWIINDYETKMFHSYLKGERNVVMPERMNPVFALPGWAGRMSIADYAEAKDTLPEGIFANLIMSLAGFGISTMGHVHLYPGMYSGDSAVPAKWTISLFGYSLPSNMKMDYSWNVQGRLKDANPTAREVIEFGASTRLAQIFTESLDTFRPIAKDLKEGVTSDFSKPRPI